MWFAPQRVQWQAMMMAMINASHASKSVMTSNNDGDACSNAICAKKSAVVQVAPQRAQQWAMMMAVLGKSCAAKSATMSNEDDGAWHELHRKERDDEQWSWKCSWKYGLHQKECDGVSHAAKSAMTSADECQTHDNTIDCATKSTIAQSIPRMVTAESA